MQLHNVTKNILVATEVFQAVSFYSRMKGLLGKKTWAANQALWIDHCPSIHTFFMNFPIDVVFVDANFKVKARYANVHPWRFILPFTPARSVFEFGVGAIEKGQIDVGDQLNVVH